MNEDNQVERRIPYFKQQFLLYLEHLEEAEILRRAQRRRNRQIHRWRQTGRFPNFQRHIFEYTNATDIHGIFHTTEGRTTCEQIFWIIIVVVSVFLSVCCIILEHKNYENTFVIVSVNESPTPVHEMAFPAVTICPDDRPQKIQRDINTILHEYWYILCTLDDENLENGSDFLTNKDFFSTINQVTKPVEEIFFRCEFYGEKFNCADLFFPTLTDVGICYTFNMHRREELFQNDVYYDSQFYKGASQLKDAWLYGASNDLRVILKSSRIKNMEPCNSLHTGYRVEVHPRFEVPQLLNKHFRVPVHKFVTIAVNSAKWLSSKQVEKMPLSKKRCYTGKDNQLKFFKNYETRQNCELECISKFVFEKCNCVQFYMPRFKNMSICGAKKFACVTNAKKQLIQLEIESRKKYRKSHCGCEPQCRQSRYTLEKTSNKWHYETYYEKMWGLDMEEDRKRLNFTTDALTMLSIYIKSPTFSSIKRQQWRGLGELLASIGGFFSLFTGMSAVCVLEFIYFFTLRIACNKIRHNNWAG